MDQELPRLTNSESLQAALPLDGSRVIDVGCGDGTLARFMTRQGSHVVGVDCSEAQLKRANAAPRVGDERFVEGVGEALPLPDASADIVVFVNSLHHVPVSKQGGALKEAARVLLPGGLLYVAEPLAEGPMFELMQPVDDETAVRAAAYAEIGRVDLALFEPLWERLHIQPRVTKGFDALKEHSLAIDAKRRPRFEVLDALLRAAFTRLATPLADGSYEIAQPIRVNLLRRR